MGTPAPQIWKRIQQTALELASRKSMPSMHHAQAIVAQIIREERAELPPEHTVATLTHELLNAIARASA